MSENQSRNVSAKLIDVRQHNPEVFTYEFQSEAMEAWAPGDSSKMFLLVGDKTVGKKFSFATIKEENRILLTTRIKVDKSAYKAQLEKLQVGSVIELSQPQGDFDLKRDNRPLVFLSNGVGIATIRSLLKAFEYQGDGVPEVVQINVDRSGHVYKEDMDDMMMRLPLTSFYTDHRQGFYVTLDGQIDRLLAAYDQKPYVYIVGSNDFIMGCADHMMTRGFGDNDLVTDAHVSTHMPACTCGKQTYCGCDHEPVEVMDLTGKFVLNVL